MFENFIKVFCYIKSICISKLGTLKKKNQLVIIRENFLFLVFVLLLLLKILETKKKKRIKF